MSETTQTQSLEQTLNRTDLGHTIYEHRKLFLGLLLAVLIGAVAFIFWRQSQQSKAVESSVAVFEFEQGIWNDVKSGKKTVDELVSAFTSLPENVRSAPVMLPTALEISKFLYDKGNYQEAETVLANAKPAADHPIATFFLKMQRVVVLERLGKTDEAIAVLEPLAQSKEVLMPARVSVELGRLYLAKGEKGKAQTQFDYVINNFPNEQEAKLAKLYLTQLAQ